MKNRATNALLEMGMPADIKGFRYIIEIMELYKDENVRHGKMMELYKKIADNHDTTPSKVERAIRHAFETVLNRGRLNIVQKYITFDNTTNGNLLAIFYIRLSQEGEAE